MLYTGKFVHMELSSGDASTVGTFVLYDTDGTVITLGSDERVILWSIGGAVATATIDIFTDRNSGGTVGAGERLFTATNTPFSMEFGPEGIPCALGLAPKYLASGAGQVDLVIVASITKG